MLDGTTDKQDARLLADINAAPDPFDGGCPADVEQAKPINHRDDFLDFVRDKLFQRELLGIKIGMNRAAQICIDAGYVVAADKIIRANNKD